MVELVQTIKKLSRSHPIFHSRADFRDALASTIRLIYNNTLVATNHNVLCGSESEVIDIWVKHEGVEVPIQIMYKTREISVKAGNKEYNLKSHAAQDQGRYDFLKRVGLIEKVVSERELNSGFVVLLTNDSAYWKLPKSLNPVDVQFRIHEGKVINGELTWGEKASPGTKKGREQTIVIRNSYEIIWNDYSHFSGQSYGRFRFLLIEVS